ncbi:hypothetical protein L1987_60676 [Smallanthus sonchifolius]|uniref:Uncharacterized protein n=1 Tax=Smallanthus sonchifolius TaxID=185202 RepID=A0ACB9D9N0_9ASTR|nr:hypothetical protein L1987_60676 [Smallanthus sonchifolius]
MPEDTVGRHAKLEEVVRELITNDINNDVKFDDLLMVDTLERLGLDYHYEDEINLILDQLYLQVINKDFVEYRDLHEVSLYVFELFKGKNGKFMENLRYDIRGLMELYEASQLCIEGENILDEAAIFSSNMLQKALDFLDDKEARMVRYTLENPHRRNITWFRLLNSPKDFDATILKELAELEYTMVQSIRRMEIHEILSRIRAVLEEIDLGVSGINRLIKKRLVWATLCDAFLKSILQWATLCDAFLVEAKWFASEHIPKSEEYLKNGIVSSGVQVFLVHMFFLLGDGSTKENANLIDNNHGIVSSVSKILRLSDDLESEQDENQDGHDGSYVKCFLMEHEYCSTKIAQEYVKKMISDAWKCLNKECISPNTFSENFLKGSINLARLVPSMYSCSHNNSFDLIEEYIRSIL